MFMNRFIVGINPHRDISYPHLFKLLCHLKGKEGAVGSNRYLKPQTPGIGHQFKYIRPHQRLTTPQRQHPELTDAGDIIQQFLTFFRGQLIRKRLTRARMTLPAPEIAGIGHLPYRVDREANAAHTNRPGSGGQRPRPLCQPVRKLLPADKKTKVQGAGCLPQDECRWTIERPYPLVS